MITHIIATKTKSPVLRIELALAMFGKLIAVTCCQNAIFISEKSFSDPSAAIPYARLVTYGYGDIDCLEKVSALINCNYCYYYQKLITIVSALLPLMNRL
jgi:hypothetical protein